jgi:hypothetical protein
MLLLFKQPQVVIQGDIRFKSSCSEEVSIVLIVFNRLNVCLNLIHTLNKPLCIVPRASEAARGFPTLFDRRYVFE